ncbi:MAG: hypothetical protein B6D58_02475 [candidate division Zixibacteria bacterium 4484_95]|nr:MAG: hypothetical protein B6D58_02475 [candidate division Zixibacteria bacterium 4484_95]RKX21144.1 MAG: hypothetical protein DRP26_00230 [candidate division Zixibacteria bacterium]
MIAMLLILSLTLSSPPLTDQGDSIRHDLKPELNKSRFSLSDFKSIAFAPTQIAQVYSDPKLKNLKDAELAPENQIKLYENFTDCLCRDLADKIKNIEFLCYDDIRKRLDDIELWNDFNLYFTGKAHISQEICMLYAEQLQVQGVITSSLMFSYYENPDKSKCIEVLFEGGLIDLRDSEQVWRVKSKCNKTMSVSTNDLELEYTCFKQAGDEFINKFSISGRGE